MRIVWFCIWQICAIGRMLRLKHSAALNGAYGEVLFKNGEGKTPTIPANRQRILLIPYPIQFNCWTMFFRREDDGSSLLGEGVSEGGLRAITLFTLYHPLFVVRYIKFAVRWNSIIDRFRGDFLMNPNVRLTHEETWHSDLLCCVDINIWVSLNI